MGPRDRDNALRGGDREGMQRSSPTWVRRPSHLIAAGAICSALELSTGAQYWSGIPVWVGIATSREYEVKERRGEQIVLCGSD